MTWNIWHGGLHGDKSVDFEQDTANTANVLKVILQENPDNIIYDENGRRNRKGKRKNDTKKNS